MSSSLLQSPSFFKYVYSFCVVIVHKNSMPSKCHYVKRMQAFNLCVYVCFMCYVNMFECFLCYVYVYLQKLGTIALHWHSIQFVILDTIANIQFIICNTITNIQLKTLYLTSSLTLSLLYLTLSPTFSLGHA
jgi:hypothetical protein